MEEKFQWYVAGLIDADGCIYISPNRVSEFNRALSVAVQVANTNLELLNFVKEITGMGYIVKSGSIHAWNVTKRELIVHLLDEIHDKLIVKKKRGELMLKFCKSRVDKLKKSTRLPYSKQELEWAAEIQQLNKRGERRRKIDIRDWIKKMEYGESDTWATSPYVKYLGDEMILDEFQDGNWHDQYEIARLLNFHSDVIGKHLRRLHKKGIFQKLYSDGHAKFRLVPS